MATLGSAGNRNAVLRPAKNAYLPPKAPPKPPAKPPTTPPSSGGGSNGTGGGLSDTQQNAYETLKALFHTYDLDTLAPEILKLIQQGYSNDTIPTMLAETDAYKQRFAGNAIREKNGLSALTPAEYLSVEDSYQQVLRSYGMPAGFYDSHSDFTNWIGTDVSPTEVEKRASIAADAVNSSDPFYVNALQQMGLTHGDMVANILDTNRALPILQKQITASQIGAEALRQGLTMDTNKALLFASQGVTQQAAQQAYQQIGAVGGEAQRLSQIYGTDFSTADLEDELLGNSGAASAKRKALVAQETNAFDGRAGAAEKSFTTYTRGEF